MRKTLLRVAALLNLALCGFHLAFWEMFNWAEELSKLTPENAAIMQMLNLGVCYTSLFGAVSTLYLSTRQHLGATEKMVVAYVGGLFVVRAAMEFPIAGYSQQGLIIMFICLAIAAVHFVALPSWNSKASASGVSATR